MIPADRLDRMSQDFDPISDRPDVALQFAREGQDRAIQRPGACPQEWLIERVEVLQRQPDLSLGLVGQVVAFQLCSATDQHIGPHDALFGGS